MSDLLDCVIIGGGPAGLTAALYFARFNRRFAVLDGGRSRARWIPKSHNFPVFSDGVSGHAMLARLRDHVGRYGAAPLDANVTALARDGETFTVTASLAGGGHRVLRGKHVLLATGAEDIEPALPDLPHALEQGLLRYCPICDGYEARGRRVGVIGFGDRGLGEAIFVARTYCKDVTLLTMGQGMALTANERRRVAEHGIKVVHAPVDRLEIAEDGIAAIRAGGQEYRFDTMYSALGLTVRTSLATALGADHDETGALIVDAHNRTSIPGLYAAGDAVQGLNQIVVAMGHAAVAATAIHNQCELPTSDEARLTASAA